MAQLLGSEAEGTGGEVSAAKKAFAFKFTSSVNATIEEFKVKAASGNTQTKVLLGICADDGTGKKPGALVEGTNEGEAELVAQVGTVTGRSVKIVSGTPYWLLVGPAPLNSGTALKVKRHKSGEAGALLSANSNTGATALSGISSWTEEELGPMKIEALGTESGAVQTSPKVVMELEVKATTTTGSGVINTAPKVAMELEVLAEVQSPGSPTEKEEGLYYGAGEEKAAEEAVKNVKATEHNCRFLDAWGAPSAGAATIITIHGGGLGPGSRSETEAVPKRLNEHGYCVFSIDYRYASTTKGALGEGIAETARTLSDVEEAVNYAKTKAEAHNGNPGNIYLLGGSAGGLLAALAAIKLNSSEIKVRGVIGFSAYGNIKAFFEEMESGKYNEPSGGHAGGSANNLIEHTQWGFQQELNYTNSSGEGTGPPVVTFATKTSAAGDRTVQKNKSPTLITVAKAIRWFLLYYEKDLIPASQQSELKTHLETEKQIQVKTHEQAGINHGWTMFASNATVRNEVFEFIEAAIAIPVVEMGLEAKATFVGQAAGGGGTSRAPLAELATVGKHSRIRTFT